VIGGLREELTNIVLVCLPDGRRALQQDRLQGRSARHPTDFTEAIRCRAMLRHIGGEGFRPSSSLPGPSATARIYRKVRLTSETNIAIATQQLAIVFEPNCTCA